MVKTIVTPDHANIELPIPERYIGKRIEVLIYPVDDVESVIEAKPAVLVEPKKPSDFKGIIAPEIVNDYQDYIKRSREEWQQRI